MTLGHLSLGVSDLARAKVFYDGALAPLNMVCVWDSPRGIGYGAPGEGDKLALYYASANRDADAFVNPDRLDVARKPNHHVAFGATGAHFCLGAQLARVEIDAILRQILSRMEDLELAGEPEWLASTFISGPKTMPVRFRPGTR